MNLVRRTKETWDPFDFVRDLQGELSRAFNTSLLRTDGGGDAWHRAFDPEIDVREEADRFLVHADLPGIKKEELDISVSGNLLTLKGERKNEKEVKEKNRYYSERMFGAFSRTLELPSEIDAGKVQAAYKDGVLEIALPKSEHAKPKQIKIDIK